MSPDVFVIPILATLLGLLLGLLCVLAYDFVTTCVQPWRRLRRNVRQRKAGRL